MPPFKPEYNRIIPGFGKVGLGALDGTVSAIGGTQELSKAAQGRLPEGSYRLDPKIFGHLKMEQIPDAAVLAQEGAIYMVSPDGSLALKAKDKTLSAQDIKNHPDRWSKDDEGRIRGGVFTVVKDVDGRHRYVWIGNRMSVGARVGHAVCRGFGPRPRDLSGLERRRELEQPEPRESP